MKRIRSEPRMVRNSASHMVALGCLLIMGGLVLVGPSGLLAWSENLRLLELREKEARRLVVERDELRNRVNLLDPRHADPDLAGELLRSDLNVVHPDEMVMLLK